MSTPNRPITYTIVLRATPGSNSISALLC